MKRLIIEVDEEFHRLVKKHSKLLNQTMRTYLYSLIFRDINLRESALRPQKMSVVNKKK